MKYDLDHADPIDHYRQACDDHADHADPTSRQLCAKDLDHTHLTKENMCVRAR